MDKSELSISDILHGLRRNKIKVIVCFCLIMGVAVALSILLPREYSSHAQLLVRLGRENATLESTARIAESARVNVSQKREFETNSVATMLRSHLLAGLVVDEIGPEVILEDGESGEAGGPASAPGLLDRVGAAKQWVKSFAPSSGIEAGPREEAIRKLSSSLQVEPLLETNVVQVSYQSRNPELSQRILSSVVDNYLEEHVRIHNAPGSHEFLMDHVQRMEDELRQAETELVDARKRTGLVSPMEQRSVIVDRLGDLKSQLFTLEATLAESQAEMDELESALAAIQSGDEAATALVLVAATSEEADGMRTKLYELELEAEGLLSKYTPEHVKARRLRTQITAAKSLLATQEVTLEIQQRKPILVSQRAKADKLREQISEVEAELAELNKNEMLIAQLTRTVDIRDATFRQVCQDAEQSRIEHSLQTAKITNISVVQPPTRNVYSVFPNTRLNLLVGLFLAILVCTGIAVFSEQRRLESERIRPTANGVSTPAAESVSPSSTSAASELELLATRPR